MVTACAASFPLRAENMMVRVDLNAQVEVRHERVTLGDVASLSGGNADTLAMWRRIPLGSAPKDGSVTRIERLQLQRWVRSYLANRQTAVQWDGAERVEITTASTKLAGAQIASYAKKSLQAWLADHVVHADISEAAESHDLFVPQGALHLTVRPIAGGVTPTKRMQLWVDVWVDDSFIRTVPVEFSVRAYQTAYIAREDVGAGSVVHAADFEKREIDVTDPVKENAIVADEDSSSWRMKHGLLKGNALLQNQVQPVPAVIRGESATLRSKNGMVELESKVEVLQDGFPGQIVKVRPTAASESILARVAGNGILEMTER
jgi:flagella basal body P-ring formation protein FlgA